MTWQPIETAPKGIAILIYYKNSCDKGRTVKAEYIERWTTESDPESDNCEYSEEKDCYYTPEGWYEVIDNWDEFSSVAICRSNTITHWMSLPEPPKLP